MFIDTLAAMVITWCAQHQYLNLALCPYRLRQDLQRYMFTNVYDHVVIVFS